MRVVFLEDVAGVAEGGDVKEVKNGFARNYLIPQRLATPATRDALQRIKPLKQGADVKRLKVLGDMKALGEELSGTRVNIEMRAGATGRLYGSVTDAIVADEIARMTEREIDRRAIQIAEPIRQVGNYDIQVRLHSEVDTDVSLLVYPAGTDPEEFLASLQEQKEGEEGPEGEAEVGTEEAAGEDGGEAPDPEDVADQVPESDQQTEEE